MEERIKQKNVIWLYRSRVEENWLATILIECVRVQSWLNHNQGIANILMIQYVPVKGRLVRRIVEHLEELASSLVKQELWV